MSKRLTVQELEGYLWGAATILRGLVDAGDGEYEGDASFPDTMMRLVPNKDLVYRDFLELILQSNPLRRQIMSIAAGTSASMKKINRKNLLKLNVPLPNVAEQKKIIEIRRDLRAKIVSVQERLARTSDMHKHLLSHLLTLDQSIRSA